MNRWFQDVKLLRMTSTAIEKDFACTLKGNYDDDAPWQAVHALRKLGTRDVFDIAAAWCKSDDPLMRARGIDVLAQLGKTTDHPVNSFPEDAYAIVSELVQRERDFRALKSAIIALGHLDNRRGGSGDCSLSQTSKCRHQIFSCILTRVVSKRPS